MSADYSRVRFDPLRDHSGVGMQQGRVWLDADFNEQVAITDRRLRAQVADLAPAPTMVSRLTPKAFEIAFEDGTLVIGAGRMYVDGLLAENHGATPTFDPVLAEPAGTDAVKYPGQRYWPVPEHWPPPKPAELPKTGGPHLVFLDVWERELTHLNSPGLVEPATHLNTPGLVEQAIGVDTTTRTQVVWQVRVLPDVGASATRDSSIPKWDDLVAPSPVRLSTTTVEVTAATGPCEVPPGKGYRGPENQLYRVELHSATQFKWSRDNAAVASAVDETLSATRLRMVSLGRDDVLAIQSNDWVEITDDRRELAQEAGVMRQVTVEDGMVISFTDSLPADLMNSTANLRVRKWNSPLIGIPTDSSPVVLEHGVAVSFSSEKTGTPRPGDFWVFAARVADASLEKLDAAAPRGIHHHYARLALVTPPVVATEKAAVTDCRPDWPTAAGDGCGCEICVTPDNHASGDLTLQDAAAKLMKAGGGTLTLCPGSYSLAAPLELTGVSSVRVRGTGRGSLLVAPGTAVAVTSSEDVVLEGFAVHSQGAGPAVVLGEANVSCRLENLCIVAPEHAAIGLAGVQMSVTIRGCTLESAVGVGAVALPADAARPATLAGLLTSDLSIQDNALTCQSRGIDLGVDGGIVIVHTGLTTIGGNTVAGCPDGGIVVTGLVPQDVAGADGALDIHGNLVEVTGSGIITGGRARIAGNTVVAHSRVADRHGIVLQESPPDTPGGVAQVLANRVSDFGGYGLVTSARLLGLTVGQNVVHGTAGGILVQPAVQGGSVTVVANQVLQLRPVTVGGPVAPPTGRGTTAETGDEPAAEFRPFSTRSGTEASRSVATETVTGRGGGSGGSPERVALVPRGGSAGYLERAGSGGFAEYLERVALLRPRGGSGYLERAGADGSGYLERAGAGGSGYLERAGAGGSAGHLERVAAVPPGGASSGATDSPAGAGVARTSGRSTASMVAVPETLLAAALAGRSVVGTTSVMMGIGVIGVAAVTVADNMIDGVAAEQQDATQTLSRCGIRVDSCVTARIAGNTIARVGHPSATVAESVGIRCGGWQDTASVSENIVRSGVGATPVQRAGWTALALLNVAASQVGAVRSVDTTAGTWTFAGDVAYLRRRTGGHLEVNGNTVEGGGSAVAVTVFTTGELVMHANRCVQPGTGEQAVVRLKAGLAAVQGNRLRGGSPSMTMDVPAAAAVVLGNITSGGIQLGGTMVANTGKPWSALNPIA